MSNQIQAEIFDHTTSDTGMDTVQVKVPAGLADALVEACHAGHFVTISQTGWLIEHPLIERLQGTMADCPLHDWLRAVFPRDRGPEFYGRWSATLAESRWTFRRENPRGGHEQIDDLGRHTFLEPPA